MNAIWQVARRDFLSYYYSLKGGVVFWFFLIFMGFFFYSFVFTFLELQQQSSAFGGQPPNLNQLLMAIFQNLQFIFLLVVPAITMASFSEEKNTHVDRLLQTAPLSSWQIILGKYFACLGLLTFVLIASSIFPLFTWLYGNPDVGILLSSYLGIFLLLASQVALGIWISSITDNQFIAFVLTMFGLFLLLILNWVAPNISSTGWSERVITYLATTSHLDSFLKGLITVKSLVYFFAFLHRYFCFLLRFR